MDQIEPKDDGLQQSIDTARLAKLNLEIRDLKKRSRWRDLILQLVPAITVLVAVLGFFFTIYQFHQGQQAARANEQTDQKIKIQSQIHSDLDQIVQCPTDKTQTVAKVSFLLQDINKQLTIEEQRRIASESDTSLLQDLTRLLRINQGQRTNADELDTPANQRRSISEVFAKMILFDINYGDPKHLDFALTILYNWDDYRDLLQTEKDQVRIHRILVKTRDALHDMYKSYPRFYAQIKPNENKTGTDAPSHVRAPSLIRYRQFEGLMNSIPPYLALIQDPNMKKERVKEIQAAICNQSLTQLKLGLSVDPKEDSAAFEECPKHK